MPTLTSIVLPVHNQADHIGGLLDDHLHMLDLQAGTHQLVLVPNGCSDDSAAICEERARADGRVKVVHLAQRGWGRAVKAGLATAEGEMLCYANSARTTPQALATMLAYATVNHGVVVKATRRTRDSPVRRLGSVLYNLECRALLGLASWDVNGTPKVFPRSFASLLRLESDDDMIDAELLAVCAAEGYPVVEVPLVMGGRHGGRSTTNLRSALGMYAGAWRLRQAIRGRAS